jgi:hypothetical protein
MQLSQMLKLNLMKRLSTHDLKLEGSKLPITATVDLGPVL